MAERLDSRREVRVLMGTLLRGTDLLEGAVTQTHLRQPYLII